MKFLVMLAWLTGESRSRWGWKNEKSGNSGYTLIELLVVAGLFGVLLIILSGAVVQTLRIQRRALAKQDLQENLRAVLELFDREVRLAHGTTFQEGQTPAGGTAFNLCNQNGVSVLWYLDHDQIWRAEEAPDGDVPCPVQSTDPADFAQTRAVSSERVVIDEFRIEQALAAGPPPNEGEPITGQQGLVTIVIRAHPAAYPDMPPLTLQMTVASRQIVGV